MNCPIPPARHKDQTPLLRGRLPGKENQGKLLSPGRQRRWGKWGEEEKRTTQNLEGLVPFSTGGEQGGPVGCSRCTGKKRHVWQRTPFFRGGKRIGGREKGRHSENVLYQPVLPILGGVLLCGMTGDRTITKGREKQRHAGVCYIKGIIGGRKELEG